MKIQFGGEGKIIEKASYSQFPLSEFEVRLPCYWRQQKGTRKERLGND